MLRSRLFALPLVLLVLLVSGLAGATITLRPSSPVVRALGRGPGWWCFGSVLSSDSGGQNVTYCLRAEAACSVRYSHSNDTVDEIGCQRHAEPAYCFAHRR